MSAERPHETDPFHLFGPTLSNNSFCTENCSSHFFHVVGTCVSRYDVYLTITDALSQKQSPQVDYSSYFGDGNTGIFHVFEL